MLPSIVVGDCGAPPNNLTQARSQWPTFVSCVLNLPQYAKGGAEDLSATNIILNVFIPPWVLPVTKVLPDGGIVMTDQYCAGPAYEIAENSNTWNLFNNGIDGHEATFIPTNSFGADGGPGCYGNNLASGGYTNIVCVFRPIVNGGIGAS
jgi:hypothetical protein